MPINIPKIFRNDESIYIQKLSREYGESYDAIHKLWDNAFSDVRMDILMNPSKHSLLGKNSIYELVGERLEKILEERKHEREGTIPDQPEQETNEQAPPETPLDQSMPPSPMPEGTGMDMASASAMPPSDMGAGATPPPAETAMPADIGAEPAMAEPPPAATEELPTVEDIMADEAF